ncbi:MAG: alpha amylase N-terminal ig-like domain-containing protein [Erysipelotrichaceae bacterium]
MLYTDIVFETKSRYAYVYKEDVIHFIIKIKKNITNDISVIAGDPFVCKIDDKGSSCYDLSSQLIKPMEYVGSDKYYDYFFSEISEIKTKRMRYAFIIDNQYLYNAIDLYPYNEETRKDLSKYFNFPYLNKEDILEKSSFMNDSIWYQITVSHFTKQGTFKSLCDKLSYLKDLGVNGLYFTPIFEGQSWHLYDTIDYFKIDKRLGTNDHFKAFVDLAHNLGMKIMVDGVFNHCGNEHPFWLDVVKKGKNSKYFDCFYIKDDFPKVLGENNINYSTFAFNPMMPKINTCHPIMQKYIIDIVTYWTREYGVDAWRLDVSNEVPHRFWRTFRQHLKAINPDILILGENWDDSYPWLMGDQFDSVMNYSFMNMVVDYLKDGKGSKNAIETSYELVKMRFSYPKVVCDQLLNFIDSHDTKRIFEIFDNNIAKIKLAFVLLLTSNGSPCILYGDEIGLDASGRDSRIKMLWDNHNLNIYEHVRKMIKIRKNYDQLRGSELRIIPDDLLLIYKKGDIYFVINNNDEDVIFDLGIYEAYDVYDERVIKIASIKALDFMIFKTI